MIAQNFPACDSLDISCCEYNVFGPNTITITVTNNSSVLFDYPSFVLFDANMDTIAMETVTYFGIGTNPQPHTMTIVAPLNLPMTGFLNLYTLFFDTLACSFPFTVPDTMTGINPISQQGIGILVQPNPARDGIAEINMHGLRPGEAQLLISDMAGRECIKQSIQVGKNGRAVTIITIGEPGCYLVTVQQEKVLLTCKLVR
jgi:hypothetical protein